MSKFKIWLIQHPQDLELFMRLIELASTTYSFLTL